MTSYGSRGLVRPRDGRIIAGVCAGLARRFNVSTTLVRLLFIIFVIAPIPSVLIYVILWLIMPTES